MEQHPKSNHPSAEEWAAGPHFNPYPWAEKQKLSHEQSVNTIWLSQNASTRFGSNSELLMALPPETPRQAIHRKTRAILGSMRRSTLGLAMLAALGARRPISDREARMRQAGAQMREMAAQHAAAVERQKVFEAEAVSRRAELTVVDAAQELRDNVSRDQARGTFEAMMRAKELREGSE